MYTLYRVVPGTCRKTPLLRGHNPVWLSWLARTLANWSIKRGQMYRKTYIVEPPPTFCQNCWQIKGKRHTCKEIG